MDKLTIEKLKTVSVLYVEDEAHIRSKIADTLKYYVKEVFEAQNGQEGFDSYEKNKPDIILCDILMPIVDGIEMVKNIRKQDIVTPIVMITAHTDKEYLLDAVRLHLENYLVKPVTLSDILTVLKKCLDKINANTAYCCTLPKGYAFDFDHKVLTYENKTIALNKKEFQFLELLIQNSHRVVNYEELQECIWKDDVMTDNAIRSVVSSLRKKLPSNLIKNLSGIGYTLQND